MILNLNTLAGGVLAFSSLLLAGCATGPGESASSSEGLKVVATTTQIGALAREVAGSSVELTVLLSGGADAHDFEPDPKAVRRIGTADVVLRHGIGLDDWLDRTVTAAGGSRSVVTVTDGVRLRYSSAHEPDEHHGDADPHVWHDVDNARVMVTNIATALAAADPANAALYRANGDAYNVRLTEVDEQVRELVASIPADRRRIVTNHDALGYFFDRYGLTLAGTVLPGTNRDMQASAKDLARLYDKIQREHITAIFTEQEVDPKVARNLASDTGVRVVEGLYADSLGPKGGGADTVDGMLLANARKIVGALQ